VLTLCREEQSTTGEWVAGVERRRVIRGAAWESFILSYRGRVLYDKLDLELTEAHVTYGKNTGTKAVAVGRRSTMGLVL
jgi:hypothetical protein